MPCGERICCGAFYFRSGPVAEAMEDRSLRVLFMIFDFLFNTTASVPGLREDIKSENNKS
jgi:hypothetical protein